MQQRCELVIIIQYSIDCSYERKPNEKLLAATAGRSVVLCTCTQHLASCPSSTCCSSHRTLPLVCLLWSNLLQHQ